MNRVGKGRIKRKDVKNFVERKKKKASYADFLIKRSDVVDR